ncbi:hypothetical protein GGR61_001149, partial [Xanthomonas arboricola]|nr:hypothetical protein [Xanthomonas sp. 3058]
MAASSGVACKCRVAKDAGNGQRQALRDAFPNVAQEETPNPFGL